MPIALDPNQTVDVALALEKQKPEGERPVFKCRFLTCRDTLRVEQLINDAHAAAETDQQVANNRLNEVLSIAVVGWRNMNDRDGQPIPFATEQFDDVLTPNEKWELVYRMLSDIQLAESDLKKSASQRESGSVPSAKPAEAASA